MDRQKFWTSHHLKIKPTSWRLDLPLSSDKMWKERGRRNLKNVIVFPLETTPNVGNSSQKYDLITLSEYLEGGKIFLSNIL